MGIEVQPINTKLAQKVGLVFTYIAGTMPRDGSLRMFTNPPDTDIFLTYLLEEDGDPVFFAKYRYDPALFLDEELNPLQVAKVPIEKWMQDLEAGSPTSEA